MAAIKIVGYLEKKGKSKVVTSWKKYWFVLEGRLLLYYTSKEEYLKLSPCKGSINMGLVTAIRPGLANLGVFDIITRTSTITLRAKDGVVQNKWLQALLESTGQSVSSPVKMNHFRYSMDDLSPSNGKKCIVRQNTLPRNYKSSENVRSNIIHKIKNIGIPISPEPTDLYEIKTSNKRNKKICCENNNIVVTDCSDKTDDVILENETYQTLNNICETGKNNKMHKIIDKDTSPQDSIPENEVILQNALYTSVDKRESTKSKNEIQPNISVSSEDLVILNNDVYTTVSKPENDDEDGMCENSQYISHTSPLYQSVDNLEKKLKLKLPTEDDMEYYCSYYEGFQKPENIYNELDPALPPRKNRTSSETDSKSSDSKSKERTSFMKFVKRYSDEVKKNNKSFKQKSKDFFTKVIRKKNKKGSKIEENIYDSVEVNIETEEADAEYAEVTQEIKPKKIETNNILIPTLAELQHKLEERKSSLRVEINKLSQPSTSTQVEVKDEPEPEENTNQPEVVKDTIKTENHIDVPPALPIRKGGRSVSPYHDIPRNNSPVTSTQCNYYIDKILEDLRKLESKHESLKNETPLEELTVKQLIERFDHVKKQTIAVKTTNDTEEVLLRDKNNSKETEEVSTAFINRHSDELNKLLEELTKVTCAPLMTPGATSSLVQMKSDGLTDEEWLALNPIRRRRHSEPDYDVPRPHRSLQILPRSPDKDEDKNDIAISATRFFGPILPPEIEKIVETPISCRSMTPDSLEVFHSTGIKSQRNSEMNTTYTIEKHLQDETLKSQDISFDICSPKNNCNNDTYIINTYEEYAEVKTKPNENFLDSLEPFVEASTVF